MILPQLGLLVIEVKNRFAQHARRLEAKPLTVVDRNHHPKGRSRTCDRLRNGWLSTGCAGLNHWDSVAP
jgi:hypothetical protein